MIEIYEFKSRFSKLIEIFEFKSNFFEINQDF